VSDLEWQRNAPAQSWPRRHTRSGAEIPIARSRQVPTCSANEGCAERCESDTIGPALGTREDFTNPTGNVLGTCRGVTGMVRLVLYGAAALGVLLVAAAAMLLWLLWHAKWLGP